MTEPCPRGDSMVRATRTGEWTDELAAHMAECTSCRESDRLVRWLMELAEKVDADSAPLPDPHLVWLKARIPGRSRDLERALLPIRIASALTAAGLGAVLAHLGTKGWSSIGQWLANGGTLVPELASLPVPSLLAILWIPVAVLLPLLLAATEV